MTTDRRFLATLVAVALAITGSSAVAAVSAEGLFRPYDFIDARLAPDGRRVALRATVDGAETLIVYDLASDTSTALLRPEGTSIDWFQWLDDDTLVFGLDEGLLTGLHAFVVDADGGPARQIGGHQQDPSFEAPEWYWPAATVGGRATSGYFHEHALYPESGLGRCDRGDLPGPGIGQIPSPWYDEPIHYLIDGRCDLRIHVRYEPASGGRLGVHHRPSRNEEWRLIADYAWPDPIILPLAFDGDDRTMLALSNVGRETLALRSFEPTDGRLGEVVAAHERYDVDRVLLGPDGRSVVGIRFATDRLPPVWLEPRRRAIAAKVAADLGGEPHDIQLSVDGDTALIETRGRRDPGTYWLLDTSGGEPEALVRRAEWISPRELAEPRELEFEARDGVRLDAVLTPPIDAKPGPRPLVVAFGRGPFDRSDRTQFDATAHFLSSRGYAVLRVDYRRSGMYASRYMGQSWRAADSRLQHDLIDAARWAAQAGYGDETRVCVVGTGLGGYAAVMAAVDEPALFRCAVSVDGLLDLDAAWRNERWRHSPEARWAQDQIGNHWSRKKSRRNASPSRLAEEVRTPILLAHGRRNDRFAWHQSADLARTRDKRDRATEVLWFDDDGASRRSARDLVTLHESIAEFLGRHLAVSSPDD